MKGSVLWLQTYTDVFRLRESSGLPDSPLHSLPSRYTFQTLTANLFHFSCHKTIRILFKIYLTRGFHSFPLPTQYNSKTWNTFTRFFLFNLIFLIWNIKENTRKFVKGKIFNRHFQFKCHTLIPECRKNNAIFERNFICL